MKHNSQSSLRKEYVSTFFKGNRSAYFVMLMSSVLFSVLNLAVAWLLQQLVDHVSKAPGALPLYVLALLTAGIILLILPLKALTYFSQPRFMRKALTQFKHFAFEKLTRKSIASS